MEVLEQAVVELAGGGDADEDDLLGGVPEEDDACEVGNSVDVFFIPWQDSGLSD